MDSKLHELTVIRKVAETSEAFSLYFQQPEGDLWKYVPGQYITLEIDIKGEIHRRAFSLSSSPYSDQQLCVTIKRIPNGIVSGYLMDHVHEGNTLKVLPPMGNFTLNIDVTHRRHYILIGAGSGITPLMSMLTSVLIAEPDSKVTVWYGNRREEDIIFKHSLIQLKEQWKDRLTVVHVLSQPPANWKGLTGHLDREQVYELILDLFMVDEYTKRYYICGPEAMMEEAIKAMDKHAIDPMYVFQEYYHAPLDHLLSSMNGAPKLAAKNEVRQDYQVKIHMRDEIHVLAVASDQSILDAGLTHGLALPYSCKGGICTTCKAQCIAGDVGMKVDIGLSEQEKKAGYVLTCQSFPMSDVEIKL